MWLLLATYPTSPTSAVTVLSQHVTTTTSNTFKFLFGCTWICRGAVVCFRVFNDIRVLDYSIPSTKYFYGSKTREYVARPSCVVN